MRNQQEAEREEQQRIKDLVLNYERMEDQNDSDGTLHRQRLLSTAANSAIVSYSRKKYVDSRLSLRQKLP